MSDDDHVKVRAGRVIGVCYYTREDFDAFRKAGVDVGEGCADWDGWHERTRQAKKWLIEAGQVPVDVPVRPDELQAWLDEQGLDNTSSARAQYAADVLRLRDNAARLRRQ